jgi:hypothetical protein
VDSNDSDEVVVETPLDSNDSEEVVVETPLS